MDGMRKCLADEFSNIHILNLRGDIRKNMLSKGRAKEGQNIFGSGSMTGIAISILVKNSDRESLGEINYCDIGSDLTRDEKLDKLKAWVDVDGVGRLGDWLSIKPNADGDWLGQRDYEFSKNILIASKKNNSEPVLFEILSSGVVSGRDSWVYGYSKSALGVSVRPSHLANDERRPVVR